MASVATLDDGLSATLDTEAAVYRYLLVVKTFVAEMGFDPLATNLIGLAYSEIAMNALRHGGGGRGVMRQSANGKGVEIRIEDFGPGIMDLETAARDGFSTYGSLGLGIGAARRSVDEVDYEKHDATGVRVVLRHYLDVPPTDIDIGVVSRPVLAHEANGDAYVIKKYQGDSLFVALIDGSGKGDAAAKTAKLVAEELRTLYRAPLDHAFHACDAAVKAAQPQRFAEMSLARITSATVEFAAIGNNFARTNAEGVSLQAQSGTLGLTMPDQICVRKFARPPSFCLLLCSDGIADPIMPTSSDHSSYQSAKSIFDRHYIGDDDATVIYVLCK